MSQFLRETDRDLMKPLVSEYFNSNTSRRAAVYVTSVSGYEIVYYDNDKEVKRKSFVAKLCEAEDMAEDWVEKVSR